MLKVIDGFEVDVHGTKKVGCEDCGRIKDCHKVQRDGKQGWLCSDCLKEEEEVRL